MLHFLPLLFPGRKQHLLLLSKGMVRFIPLLHEGAQTMGWKTRTPNLFIELQKSAPDQLGM